MKSKKGKDVKFPRYMKADQVKALELEVVSTELKVFLTRLLHESLTTDSDGDFAPGGLIIRQNRLVNKSRNLQGAPLYRLESDDDGNYHSADYAWHEGEFQLIFRRLDTPQFVEFLGDLIREDELSIKKINGALERDAASFRFEKEGGKVSVEVLTIENLEEKLAELDTKTPGSEPHINIRLLFSRAEDAVNKGDGSAVIHACASIFETLAKDIIADPNIMNQPLGGFFEKYRKNSALPAPVLDYILDQYKLRNTTPLAGHGSPMAPPALTHDQAVMLVEVTRAFVRTEYRVLAATSAHP